MPIHREHAQYRIHLEAPRHLPINIGLSGRFRFPKVGCLFFFFFNSALTTALKHVHVPKKFHTSLSLLLSVSEYSFLGRLQSCQVSPSPPPKQVPMVSKLSASPHHYRYVLKNKDTGDVYFVVLFSLVPRQTVQSEEEAEQGKQEGKSEVEFEPKEDDLD